MFATDNYAAVRRFVFIEGHSRCEAARVFGLSRETVLKMCRFSLPPGYTRTAPVAKPKLAAPGTVPHGWRSTFRDWAAEATDHPEDVCEAALAHLIGNATTRAYLRTKMLDKRRPLMNDWAAFLALPPTVLAQYLAFKNAEHKTKFLRDERVNTADNVFSIRRADRPAA